MAVYHDGRIKEEVRKSYDDSGDEYFDAVEDTLSVPLDGSKPLISPSISVSTMEGDPPEIEEDKDFHEGDNIESVLSSNRSVVLQILSQIRIGMDLTRFVMPVFIFEKRSLLELYAEFFTHPDIVVRSADLVDPKERMIGVTKWFLSSLSASRKVGIPKKPYNPILGEVFRCYWDLPSGKRTPPNLNEKQLLESGPVSLAGYDSLSFITEQVSHHPPVSAMYAECPSKRVYFTASAETKLKFQLGFSVKVLNIGTFEVHYMNHDEIYVGNFPNAYVRSILTTPWLEFAGECKISCAKTGYSSVIEFHTKPFRGGQKHRMTGSLRHIAERKPLLKLEGHWNSVVFKKMQKDNNEVFMDVRYMPRFLKKVKRFSLQAEYESRIVWRCLTEALEREDSVAAAAAKHEVEEQQREKARELKKAGEEWPVRFFSHDPDNRGQWVYNSTLKDRLKDIS